MTPGWNGSPPNGQGMYHWLVNKDHGRHVVAWFDLHEWTAFGKTQTKQEIARMYDYLAPCLPPSMSEREALNLGTICSICGTSTGGRASCIMVGCPGFGQRQTERVI